MTTVGYGDMSGKTTYEQFFCCGLMLFGVFFFSMIGGSMASILSTLDQNSAELESKVVFLFKLKEKYDLPPEIVEEITKSLNYDSRVATTGLIDFVNSLPPQLRMAVCMSIYQDIFTSNACFQFLRNRRLLAFIAKCFHPTAYEAGQYIYK